MASRSGSSHKFFVSASGCYRTRGVLGLLGTRQQKSGPGVYDNVPQIIMSLRPAYPNMGARSMVVLLRWEHGIKIPEYVAGYASI